MNLQNKFKKRYIVVVFCSECSELQYVCACIRAFVRACVSGCVRERVCLCARARVCIVFECARAWLCGVCARVCTSLRVCACVRACYGNHAY